LSFVFRLAPSSSLFPYTTLFRSDIIGVNPFVFVPEDILKAIFEQAGKDKGPIPIKGLVNGKPYTQTLVKYSGEWRLYINMIMLKDRKSTRLNSSHVKISYAVFCL